MSQRPFAAQALSLSSPLSRPSTISFSPEFSSLATAACDAVPDLVDVLHAAGRVLRVTWAFDNAWATSDAALIPDYKMCAAVWASAVAPECVTARADEGAAVLPPLPAGTHALSVTATLLGSAATSSPAAVVTVLADSTPPIMEGDVTVGGGGGFSVDPDSLTCAFARAVDPESGVAAYAVQLLHVAGASLWVSPHVISSPVRGFECRLM